MLEAQYYLSRTSEKLGPFSLNTLRHLAASGQLLPYDLIYTEAWDNWRQADTVPDIFDEDKNPIPPSPNTPPPPPLPPSSPNSSPPPPTGPDAAERMLLPVGRTPLSIAAGYLGLLSLLILPAPIALLVSIFAIKELKQDPTKHGMGRALFGLIMGALFSILLIISIMTVTITSK